MLVKSSPLFVIRFFLLALLFLCPLILLIGCAAPIIKMPKPTPDIIKEYKSFFVYAGPAGMYDSGVWVQEGDYVTIIADGKIDIWPALGGHIYGPTGRLLYRIGEKNYASRFYGYPADSEIVRGSGNIYLGYDGGAVDAYGEALKPMLYYDDRGFFVVDIIVWKKKNPVLVADFFEEASRNDPENKILKSVADAFKYQREILLAKRKETKEVEETKKAVIDLKKKEISEAKMCSLEITPEISRQLRLDEAGVKSGDVICELNGQEIRSRSDYEIALAKVKKGEAIRLSIKRGERRIYFFIPGSPGD